MDCDESWDFNAPQFVDFTSAKAFPDDDDVESYFDFDHENGIPVNASLQDEDFQTPMVTQSAKKTRSSAKKIKQEQGTPVRTTRSQTPKAKLAEQSSKENITPKSVNIPVTKVENAEPKNLCTNLQDWKKKTSGAVVTNGQNENTKKEGLMKSGVKRQNRSLDRGCSTAKKQKEDDKPRRSIPTRGGGIKRSMSFNSVIRPESTEHAVRNHSRGLSGDRSSAHKRATSTDRAVPLKNNKLTVANSPSFMRRKPIKHTAQKPVKNTEEMELEKIAQYKQELAKKKKQHLESYKQAMQGKGPTVAVHPNKETTKPQEFNFETDRRLKTHGMETRQDGDARDFASILRSNKEKSSTTGAVKAGPTIPEPFHFASQKKRKLPDMDEKQAQKYESMAQKLAQFNATPDRFRSKPKTGPATRGRSKSPPGQGMTVPRTPHFETRTRARPVTAPSREQLEEKELEELKKHQVKANPVNPKIFAKPNMKKAPKKTPTVPEGFQLSSNHKSLKKEENNHEEHFEFHAQPLNKKILEGVVGVQEPKKAALTVPESPAFALKHRARIPSVETKEKEEKQSQRIRAAPHFGVPFQPQYEHKYTEPAPFAFEDRERAKAEQKARKIEQALEEEARMREFHANPIPDMDPQLPEKRKKAPTVPQPFNLGTETRGMKKADKWSHEMEGELRQQKELARFKARDPRVLESEPFVPAKTHKHTTEFSEFEMNTAKRCVKREVFEMHKKAKQDEKDNIRRQEQRMKEVEEQAELERIRRTAVPKAQPVKHYKTVTLKASQKPLTAPMSPSFKTDQRLRLRAQLSESQNSFAST